MRALHFLVIFSLIFNSQFSFGSEVSDSFADNSKLTENEKLTLDGFFKKSNERMPQSVSEQKSQDSNTIQTTDEVTAKESDNGAISAEMLSRQFKSQKLVQIIINDEKISAYVTDISDTPNGIEIEVAYTKANGSMSSRKLLAQEFFQTNPKIKAALDKQLSTDVSVQTLARKQPPAKAPIVVQTNDIKPKSKNRAPASLDFSIPVVSEKILNDGPSESDIQKVRDNENTIISNAVPVQPDQTLKVKKITSTNSSNVAEISIMKNLAIDPAAIAGDARNKLDYLAKLDRLDNSRLSSRQRESLARKMGIYDADKTAGLDYRPVSTKKTTRELFEKIFATRIDFDIEMLRSTLSFNPRGGYIGIAEFRNAEKFVQAIQKADIDGSKLSLSERQLLNKFTDRAPLYARQINPEIALINPQSLEAFVPPRITNNKVTTMASRGDEFVELVKIKPDMVRAEDQVIIKNFEGTSDLKAWFINRNYDGTIRVKDSEGKEFNLGPQATSDSQFYRGLTAEVKVNGALDNSSRVNAAEAYVKRELTATQKNAVISSHNIGGEGQGYFDYTADELKQKTEILRKAGFSNIEAALLVRKGIIGNNPTEISKLVEVKPIEIRRGDEVVINDFNGTGELRGQIIGSATNGGLVLREASGVETTVYKSDLNDLTNSKISRNPNARMVASGEELSLKRAPIVAVKPKKVFSVKASDVRIGDKVLINDFNGAKELEGIIVAAKKDDRYLLLQPNGLKTTLYKSDLNDPVNVKINRESGLKIPKIKVEEKTAFDTSADSPLLVSKDKKINPDIAVPLGSGELRQGRVLSQVDPKPGLPKTYVVEYLDEVGVTSQIHLSQDELLAANTPKALEKVKADRLRSLQYQSKSNSELQQLLDEGNRAAKEAVGKGRAVDKPDLSAEAQSALSELARRNQVTSSAVFEAYRRGGIKGLENLAVAHKLVDITSPVSAVTPITAKSLSQYKTGDFVVTAGIGDKVTLPKSKTADAEAIVLSRDKVDGEVIYTVGIKKADGSHTTQKITDRELGDANPFFVGVRVQLSENDHDVVTPDGSIYTNVDRSTDERFSALLHSVSQTKTDEIKAAAANFSTDKQSVISQAMTGKFGLPNKAVKRDIGKMQFSVDQRQGFINNLREALDQVDASLGTLVSKSVHYGDQKYTKWQVSVNQTKITFDTPINLSRSEAMAQLRELSREERIKLLNSQARLDDDKAHLAELRTKVGVAKPPEPLNGPSVFQITENKNQSRNIAVAVKGTQSLVNDLEGVIGERGRKTGLRNTSELTAGHPLTPVIEKQRQIIHRLNQTDRELEPENFARISTNVANDLVKSGEADLALPYYRVAAETIENNLGLTAKDFWANEANIKAAIKTAFIADNQELAYMATEKSVLAKVKSNTSEDLKKVALDQFYNLGYEFDKISYGVKRYNNKNKELDLLVIRKQQQYIAEKFNLTKDIEDSIGQQAFERIDSQAHLTVDHLLKNPAQMIEPDKLKK